MKKRIVSIILAVMMIASMLPLGTITAFAAEDTEETLTLRDIYDKVSGTYSGTIPMGQIGISASFTIKIEKNEIYIEVNGFPYAAMKEVIDDTGTKSWFAEGGRFDNYTRPIYGDVELNPNETLDGFLCSEIDETEQIVFDNGTVVPAGSYYIKSEEGIIAGLNLYFFGKQNGKTQKLCVEQMWQDEAKIGSVLNRIGDVAHEHTYSTEWSYNDSVHWHACTCEDDDCKGLVSGFGVHSYTSISDTQHQCACGKIENHAFVNGECVCGAAKTEYTVTFDLQDYEFYLDPIEPIYVINGNTFTAPTAPYHERYIFGGWYREPECITPWDFENDTVTEDITLYAKCIPASCTLWFYLGDDGDTRIKYRSAHYGELMQSVEPPVKDGFVFLGYYDIGKMGNSSIQYFNADGECIRAWDKEDSIAYLVAHWAPSGTGSHTHVFASAWNYNDTHHWHECACQNSECSGFISGFGEHSFDRGIENGFVTTYTCTDCGYQKEVLRCDINKDGNVDANDLILVQIALLSGCDYYDALDCNNDGKFDLLDMVKLKNCCANVTIPSGK